ncbi:MAG: hypothetical protein K0U52_14030 [Gammaproteobacteria bacterium]|nr:hypothetical protein [Gammaproteobacteria bacterium]
MSIQLVLHPQGNSPNQIIVDGVNFFGVNNATNYSTTSSFTDIMSNAYPTIPNTWYKFINTSLGTPSQAAGTGGKLLLSSVVSSSPGTQCGVYQQLSGLVVGESYTLTIDLTSASGNVLVSVYNGQIGSTQTFSATTSQITANFTALSENDTIFITYQNTSVNILGIDKLTLTGKVENGVLGQVICDLYEDEEIPLTLSIDDFKNVAEKIQSYSKDFNLPATKRNNQIFGNIFEITRTVANPYDFNPYVRTRAVLKQDGIILFDGALRLIDIQDREGEISYNVNLYAQTIALADTLKNKTFDNINFNELQHSYNKTIIKGSWYVDGLTLINNLPTGTYAGVAGTKETDVLKYPFVDWTHQMLYANGATGTNATLGTPELTSFEQAFRPFIKIKYLIDRIFSDAGYTYSSGLFESTEFGKLFMDFNWGGDTMPSVIGDTSYTATYAGQGVFPSPFTATNAAYVVLPLLSNTMTGGLTTSEVPPDYTESGVDIYKIVCTENNQLYNIDYSWEFETVGGTSISFRWVRFDASTSTTSYIDVQTEPIGNVTGKIISGNFSTTLDTGDKLWAEFISTSVNSISLLNGSGTTPGTVTFNLSSSLVDSAILNSLRGEINQWDFLKGIMTMFNLVTLQDNTDPANIIIKPYADVFIKTTSGTTLKERSIQADWTDKVDLKDVKLTPLNDLKKKTIFKYEEDEDDYVFNVYKKSTTGHLYGSKVFSAENLTLLEGEEEIVASPFAATVSKPLWSQLANFITPAVYAMDDDGASSSFENKPRILYQMNSSPVQMSSTYFIPAQNGTSSENSDLLFTFSHLTSIPTVVGTTDDYNFGETQYFLPIGQTVTSNLFNNYWLPYYNQLYNPDTKTMTLKVNLTAGDIAQFSFTDYIMIKNRAYRVNRIDYKPKDLSTVEFILIN